VHNGKYIKYTGQRNKEAIEQFALGDYLYNESAEEIPKQLEGVEYAQKWLARTTRDFMSEIDHLFASFGLADMIPPPARYTMVASLVFIPCMVLGVLLFCFSEDFESAKPKQARVAGAEHVHADGAKCSVDHATP
jgi:hypothetical protein